MLVFMCGVWLGVFVAMVSRSISPPLLEQGKEGLGRPYQVQPYVGEIPKPAPKRRGWAKGAVPDRDYPEPDQLFQFGEICLGTKKSKP